MEMTGTAIWTVVSILVSVMFLSGVFFMLTRAEPLKKIGKNNAKSAKRVKR